MKKHIHRAKRIKGKRDAAKENPRVRPLLRLLKYNFYIPRYQRGYRWGKQEITELLNDLLHYHNLMKQINPFYCLQPIVVRRKSWTSNDNQAVDGWEVIDGQQRLITLLLILNYLETIVSESMVEKLGEDIHFYTINFESRANSKDFLESKRYKYEIDQTNIDFYHLSKAYQHISDWFDTAKLDGVINAPNHILNILLGSEQNASVIWYEYGEHDTKKVKDNDDESSLMLFTKLNEGKIPLTDSELIKALLLQSDIYTAREKKFVNQRLLEIATQWDEIEAKLLDDKMWYFINDPTYQPISKIEFLFDLLADKWNGYEKQTFVQYDIEKNAPINFNFIVFEKYLRQVRRSFSNNLSDQSHVLDPINEIWAEIKELFVTIEEWYNSHTLYHYIGFLLTVTNGSKKALLKELTELRMDKDLFLTHIKKKIAQEVSFDKELHVLQYGNDNAAILKILLLMDIETVVKHKKEIVRFPFHLHKKHTTNSIVHINPPTPHSVCISEEAATTWLNNHKQSLLLLKEESSNSKKAKIDNLLEQFDSLLKDFCEDKFQKVMAKTIEFNNKIVGMKEENMHSLHNLTLIDKKTSNQLYTSFFDVKRSLLKENLNGKYIPLHTQRVFSKYYSEKPKEMVFWNKDDQQKHFTAIKQVHDSYIQLISKGQ